MLQITDVTVRFGDVTALDRMSLDVPTGSVTVVMGPSGCGKSTLLRVVAGLEAPATGTVSWMNRALTTTPAHQRGFGLMFQDYALFPHRSVGANVAFGLRMANRPSPEIDLRVDEVLELVGMSGYRERRIHGLSGGEQQRVALARALAPSPSLLMLDEPIGALDRDLRSRLMTDMRHIFTDLDLTVLYVTHDQDEAFGLGDHVAVMRGGKVLRTGTPEGLWADPGSRFVARFMGRDNVIGAEDAADLYTTGLMPTQPDGAVTIAPDALTVTAASDGNGIVVDTAFIAGRRRIAVDVGRVRLITYAESPPIVGSRVDVRADPRGVIALTEDGGEVGDPPPSEGGRD